MASSSSSAAGSPSGVPVGSLGSPAFSLSDSSLRGGLSDTH
jgi:hypothetical protein